MFINLERISDDFFILRRFLARTTSYMVDEVPTRDKVPYETDDIMQGLNELYFYVGMGQVEFSMYEGYVNAVAHWLGEQGIEDTRIILERMNVGDTVTLEDLHRALYNLFDVLDDELIEEGL